MVNLKFNHNKGFTIAEGMVSLVVFSLIMLLYLPAFYLELGRMTSLNDESERWRVFYELSLVQLSETLSSEAKASAIQKIIDTREVIGRHQVRYFSCELTECLIIFEDGSDYSVELQEIVE